MKKLILGLDVLAKISVLAAIIFTAIPAIFASKHLWLTFLYIVVPILLVLIYREEFSKEIKYLLNWDAVTEEELNESMKKVKDFAFRFILYGSIPLVAKLLDGGVVTPKFVWSMGYIFNFAFLLALAVYLIFGHPGYWLKLWYTLHNDPDNFERAQYTLMFILSYVAAFGAGILSGFTAGASFLTAFIAVGVVSVLLIIVIFAKALWF